MTKTPSTFRLGIISCIAGSRDAEGRLFTHQSVGCLIERFAQAIPNTKLCFPYSPQFHPKTMTYQVGLPDESVVPLPPLGSVLRSQKYYFQTRRMLKAFARDV